MNDIMTNKSELSNVLEILLENLKHEDFEDYLVENIDIEIQHKKHEDVVDISLEEIIRGGSGKVKPIFRCSKQEINFI